MAGTLNVDTLKADSNLKLQIASANVAFIDANGLTIVGNSLNIGGTTITSTQLSQLNANGTISASAITSVNANTITSGTIPLAQVPQLTSAKMPTGTVLQVVSTTKTDTFSSASGTDVAITGLSATITPLSTTSKILVLTSFSMAASDTYNVRFNLYRNASLVTAYRGDSRGGNARAAVNYRGLQGGQNGYNAFSFGNMNYLDSPASTSALTYQVYGQGNGTFYVNRPVVDADTSDGITTASTITVMEIAG